MHVLCSEVGKVSFKQAVGSQEGGLVINGPFVWTKTPLNSLRDGEDESILLLPF